MKVTLYTKFGQLVGRKIIEIVATKCHILRLKCTKFDYRWGSAPDPAGGAYSVPPDSIAGFKGPPSKGGMGREGRELQHIQADHEHHPPLTTINVKNCRFKASVTMTLIKHRKRQKIRLLYFRMLKFHGIITMSSSSDIV